MQNLLDPRIQNNLMQESLKTSIEELFPISSNGKTLIIENVKVDDNLSETDFPAQKEIKAKRGSWSAPIMGDIKIVDDATGKTISYKKDAKIGSIPKLTNRLSAIVKGNEYQVFNQIRRRPGVYNRQRRNGQLESEFNLAKGSNFSIQQDPEKGIYNLILRSGTRKYPLYTVLSALGKLDSEMQSIWGKKLFDKNKAAALNTEESDLRDLHKKLIGSTENLTVSKVKDGLKSYFDDTRLDAEVTEITLGAKLDTAGADTMLASSKKLLDINLGKAEQDDRDSLIFKNIYTPDDLVHEYFKGNKASLQSKLKNGLKNRDQVREVVAASTFTKPIERFFTMSDLSSTPPQTNPVAMAVNARKTTIMGEGGITNTHAITNETRDVSPSHVGFLDNLASPESLKIGTNVGLSSGAFKKGNQIVTPVVTKDGKIEYKSPLDIYKSVVGFPDEFTMENGKPRAINKKVKAYKAHKPVEVSPEEVDFYYKDPSGLFDFGANLIPYLPTVQGNRGSTAGRMITQALPLDNPDEPLTKVVRDKDSTFESLLGSYSLPSLEQETNNPKLGGTVEAISDEYIKIKGDDNKTYNIGLYKDFPLNQDGYINSTPVVNVGDKVTGNQLLAKSNYTTDKGELALGKNLTVAYLSYKGNSFEDGATITESAAKKLSHTTIDKINVFFNPKMTTFNLKQFNAYYPDVMTPSNARKLTSDGLPKVGQEFLPGEVLSAFLVKKEIDDLDQALRRLNKATYTPYAKNVTTWDEDDPGVVTDVRQVGRNIDIYVKSTHPFKEGDKLCVSMDTDFFTKERGWVPLLDLKGSETFATLNPETRNVEWQPASEINIYDHDDKLYHVKTETVDQLVTEEHRLFHYINGEVKSLRTSPVSYFLTRENTAIPLGVNEVEALSPKLKVPKYLKAIGVTAKNYVELIALLVSYSEKTEKETLMLGASVGGYSINEDLVKLVTELDVKILKMFESPDSRLTVFSEELNLLYNNLYTKGIPECIKFGRKKVIERFFKAFFNFKPVKPNIKTLYKKSHIHYKELLGMVGLYGLNVYTKKRDDYFLGEAHYEFFHNFTEGLNAPGLHRVRIGSIKEQKYSGRVGCPTTENGIVLIKRNGLTSWTGNSSRYGDKHIIGKIIPDDDAPHRPDGTPVDIMVNPQGVQGRMNMGQMLDTAAGKIAMKTGKPILVENFNDPNGDMSKKVYDMLKKEGIEPNEVLTDGKNGDPLKNPVFVGNRQYLKLRHLVKKKLGKHSTGIYDIDEQTAGKGAQKVGTLDTYAYLAHGSKNLLREATEIKSRENEEYFRNLQFGLPPSKPNTNFVFDKMLNYMRASGVDVEKKGNKYLMSPLSDSKITELSKGSLDDPGSMLIGKNLATRKGGLFDPDITGGMKGENYAHIDLPSRLPNPMAALAIKSVLNLPDKEYDNILKGKAELNGETGAKAIVSALGALNVDEEYKLAKEELKNAADSQVNKLNTKVRILQALSESKSDPVDSYTTSKFLVIPPKYRPIYDLPSGDLQVSDINKHYRDVGLKAKGLKEAIDEDLLTDDEKVTFEHSLYESLKSAQGFTDPITYGKQKYKGALKDLGHTTRGLIFGKAWAKRQDLSGRSTVTPEPSFGLDEVGIPEPMAKEIFKPFVIRKMVQSGMPASKAKKEMEDYSPLAKNTLLAVMREKPVVLNRAPSLHKHSVQSFKPKLVPGKDIRTNPLIVSGFNMDYDGDCLSDWLAVTYDFKKVSINSSDLTQIISILKDTYNLTEISATMIANDYIMYKESGEKIVKNIHIKDFPHTNVVTKDKDTITDYEVPDFIEVFALHNGVIKPMPVTNWSVHTELDMFEVRLNSGKTTEVSSDHSLICFNPEKGEVDKIKPEDAIGKLTPIPMAFAGLASKGKQKSKDDGYFVGAMVGDGWVNSKKSLENSKGIKNKIMLANNDPAITKKVASYVGYEGYSLSNTHDFDGHECNSTKTTRSDAKISKYLRENIGCGAINKKLPDDFITNGKDYAFGLISGLLDTDGSICITNKDSKKRKQQYSANYTTVSRELSQQVQQLFASVGVRTSLGTYERKNTVYQISISMPDLIKVRDSLCIQHPVKKSVLAEAVVTKDFKDVIPVPKIVAEKLQGAISNKEHASLYTIASKAKKTGAMSRSSALKIKELLHSYTDVDYLLWLDDYVENYNLVWDVVKSISPTENTTAWDITIPGPFVFMTSNLITVQDTVSVMVPVTAAGESDAWNMLPSKNLFKAGDNGLVPSISQEYLYGVSALSDLGKDTGKSFTSIDQAKKEIKDMTDVFMLNGKKMTIGQWEINKILPEKYKDYGREFRLKMLAKLLEDIAKNEPAETFAEVINHFKDLGAMYSYKVGATLSIDDMVIDRGYRDDLIKKYKPAIDKIKDKDKKVEAYMSLMDRIGEAQNEQLKGKNRMVELIERGALSVSKSGNVRQVLSAPGIVVDTKGTPMDIPILKSYSEGLSTFDYMNTLPGVRKGTVDRSVNTQESGALNKVLLSVNRRLLITEEDCGTNVGKEFEIDSPHLMGRTLLNTVMGVGKRGELITEQMIMSAKSKKINSLKARTPLECDSVQGVCQKCYGSTPDGKLAEVGTNVGVLDSSAITERATQLGMQAFHCMHQDSLILVKEAGLTTFKDLWESLDIKIEAVDGEEYKFLKTPLHIWDKDKWSKMHKIFRHVQHEGTQMMLTRTRSGRGVVAQDNHPHMLEKVIDLSPSGKPWIKPKKLGKYVDPITKIPRKGPRTLSFDTDGVVMEVAPKDIVPRMFTNFSEFPVWGEDIITPFADPYLVGFFVGEGCYTRYNSKGEPYGLTWCQGEEGINKDVKDKAANIILRDYNKVSRNNKSLILHDSVVARIWYKHLKNLAKNKSLGQDFTSWSDEDLGSLLSGLIDAEGSPIEGSISMELTSWLATQQVALILSKFGIRFSLSAATVKELTRNQSYALNMYPYSEHKEIFKESLKMEGYNYPDKLERNNIDGLVSYNKPIYVHNPEENIVYDIQTESGTLTVNGFWTHNSGGAAKKGSTVSDSFPRLEQLLKVPQKISGKAVLSKVDGVVQSVKRNEIGGYDIDVSGTKHTGEPGFRPTVKVSDSVTKGDQLTEGVIKPQELAELKDFSTARNYIIDEIGSIYGDGFHKKSIETVIRGITDNAKITEAPDDTEMLRGDKVSLSFIKDFNKKRDIEGLAPVKYTPYMKSIEHLNHDSDDWFTRITTNRVKDTLSRASAKMQWGDVAGKDPIPAYIYGDDFGDNKKKGGDGFY